MRISGDVLKGFVVDIPLSELGVNGIDEINITSSAFKMALVKNGVHVNISEDGLNIDGMIPLDESGEEIFIPSIGADMHSDDYVAQAKDVDVSAWFEQASDEDILSLATHDFGACDKADEIARFMENRNDEIGKVFAYLAFGPKMPNGDAVGFSVSVVLNDVRIWAHTRRPHLVAALYENDDDKTDDIEIAMMNGDQDRVREIIADAMSS